MKKLIVSICVFVAFLSVFSVPAYAGYYALTYTADYSKAYNVSMASGVMMMRYKPGSLFSSVTASTELSVANDQIGTAYVYIKAANNQEINRYGTYKDGNTVYSGEVTIRGQKQAKDSFHSVERRTPLTGAIDAWACDCD